MAKQYYRGSTEKAIKNFPFSFRKTDREFMHVIVEIKKVAEAVKEAIATEKTLRAVVLGKGVLTKEQFDALTNS